MKIYHYLLLALGLWLTACNQAATPTSPSTISDSPQLINTLATSASPTLTSTIPEPTATPTASQAPTKTHQPSATPTKTIAPTTTPTPNLLAPGYLLAYENETGISISNSEGYGHAQVFSPPSSFIMNFFWGPEGDSLYVVTGEKIYQVIINLENPTQSTVTEIYWGDDIGQLYSAIPAPNGEWVALEYSRWESGVPSMCLLNLSTGRIVDLAFAGVGVDELGGVAFSERPWSSDGQQIAFTAGYYKVGDNMIVGEGIGIFTANIDGTLKGLSQYEYKYDDEDAGLLPTLSSPVWIPGRKTLYFYLAENDEVGIFKLSSQGGQATQVISQDVNCHGKMVGPILSRCFDLSADGNWMFFEGFDENYQLQPTFLQLQTIMPFTLPTETYLFLQTHAIWSPVDAIATVPCTDINSNSTQLCAFDFSESDIKLIAPASGAQVGENPVWSPDGKQIAFEDEGLFVMNPDGSNLHMLAPGYVLHPTWSPVKVSDLVEAIPTTAPTVKPTITTSSIFENINQLGGTRNAIEISGQIAYVGVGPRLHLFDISNPTAPLHLGQSPVAPGIIRDLQVVDGFAYVALSSNNSQGILLIYDVSVPTDLHQVGEYSLPDRAKGIYISGDASHRQAYVAAGEVYILNVSDPADPIQIGVIATPEYAEEVTVTDEFAYVLGGSSMLIFDIADLTTPIQKSTYVSNWYTQRIVLDDDLAYITSSYAGIDIVNIADPSNPFLVGNYGAPIRDHQIDSHDISVIGDQAYVSDCVRGLLILDISDPQHPDVVGEYSETESCTALAVDENLVYFPGGENGPQVLDISNPSTPSLANWQRSAGITIASYADGERLYAMELERLHIYDISNVSAITKLAFFDDMPADFSTRKLVVENGYAYLAGRSDSLLILSVADLENIHVVAPDFSASKEVEDIAIVNNYAYLAEGTDGLRIINITDPTSPQQVGTVSSADSYFSAVQVVGDFAYVAANSILGSQAGLHVINISNPNAPVEIGSFPLNYADDLVISGNHAYVAGVFYGVHVLDITNPAAPNLIKTIDYGEASSVALANEVVFVAGGSDGLWAIDVSNPASPRFLAVYPSPYDIFSVTTGEDNSVFALDFDAGLMIFSQGG